ncbi:MAG: hypothetical protein ACRDTZ_05365 [Pseudonocardiaceae bacterium]
MIEQSRPAGVEFGFTSYRVYMDNGGYLCDDSGQPYEFEDVADAWALVDGLNDPGPMVTP